MLYALHVIRHATDEASRAQTLDEMLEDLRKEPNTLTDEQRRAAPFVDCYQICPYTAPCTSTSDSTAVIILPSPCTYLVAKNDTHDLNLPHLDTNKRGASESLDPHSTHYCIIEPDGEPSENTLPRRVPLYGPCADGAVTLWRIPMRSPGLFFANADSHMFRKGGNPRLYDVFHELQAVLNRRDLPAFYTQQGGDNGTWVDILKSSTSNSSKRGTASDFAFPLDIAAYNDMGIPILPLVQRDSSSESSSS
ncbi:hypothetical protein PENSPDRAFT_733559 [Peniophora sp. CONT]|nr:hypothetical protein PENSPDRAFT_733559 [Peniophora sp. CONT]